MLVTPHAGHNNVVFLSSLEGIDTGYFDFFVEFFLERSVELHVADDVGSLSFVRRDDSNLTGKDSRFKESSDNLLHIRSFSSAWGKIFSILP